MGIINNMPSKSGLDIDGVEKTYFVYQGEAVNAGDFVEVLQGTKLKEGTYNETLLDLTFTVNNKSYGITSMDRVIPLNETTIFVFAHSSSFSSYRNHAFVLQVSSDTSKFSVKCFTEIDYYSSYDSWKFVNEHTLLHFYGQDNINYETYAQVIYISEDWSSISEGTKFYREGNVSDGWGGDYLSLTDNTGVIILNHYSGGYDAMYYFATFSGSGMTYTEGKYLYYANSTTNFATSFNRNVTALKISDTQFIYGPSTSTVAYLFTVDKVNQTVVASQFTGTLTNLNQSTNYKKILLDNNLWLYYYARGSSYSSYIYIVSYDISNLTMNTLYTITLSTSYPISDILKIDGNHIAVITSKRFMVIEINENGYFQYDPITMSTSHGITYYNAVFSSKACVVTYNGDISIFNIIYPEMQVRKALTQTNQGIAKTSGVGGTEQRHNEQVTVIIPNTTE